MPTTRAPSAASAAWLPATLLLAACSDPRADLSTDGLVYIPSQPAPAASAASAIVVRPRLASDSVSVTDLASSVAITFALVGASDAPGVGDGDVTRFVGAAPGGGDVIHRLRPDGIEDFVTFGSRPAREEVRYRIDVSRIAGLRLVGSTVELLDRGGAPRLRMAPPFVLDAVGCTHPAEVHVSGCSVNTDPRAPWGRPVAPPGASSCEIVVSWGGARCGSWSGARCGSDTEVVYPAVLDPTWITTGSMLEARSGHTATRVEDLVLVVGGFGPGAVALASAELFDPASGTWAATAPLGVARGQHVAVDLGGDVLVAGGAASDLAAHASAEVYRIATATFEPVPPMTFARRGHVAARLANGRVLVAGGRDGGGAHGASELFDAVSSSWMSGPISAPQFSAALLATDDGDALLTGGATSDDWSSDPSAVSSAAERYDATAGAWLPLPDMVEARADHQLVWLGDGRVLAVGGAAAGAFSSSTEILDTATWGPWRPGPALTYARAAFCTARFSSGTLVVVGGFPYGNTVELLSADRWLEGPVLQVGRQLATCTVLPDGALLVAGGLSANGSMPLASAEVLRTELVVGATCTQPLECASGFCVDGICCESECAEPCHGCAARVKGAGTDGACETVTAGLVDPRGACTASADAACGYTGLCAADGACAHQQAGASCTSNVGCPGSKGECDGAGVCLCSGPRCEDGRTLRTPGALDGGAELLVDCAPYRCLFDACTERCDSSDDCTHPWLCDEQHHCIKPSNEPADDGCGCRIAGGAERRTTGGAEHWLLAGLAALCAFGRRIEPRMKERSRS